MTNEQDYQVEETFIGVPGEFDMGKNILSRLSLSNCLFVGALV